MAPSIVRMRQGVAEVFRMKRILDHKSCNGDGSDVHILCETLTRLRDMRLTVKTLETTGIGKSVRLLQKHVSKDVRDIAGTLMKSWKAMANAWFDATEKKPVSSIKVATMASVEVGKSNTCKQKQQKTAIQTKLKTERKAGVPETAKEQRNVMNLEDEEDKFKATKRKLQQGYEKVENMKRQRKIQVMEVHEVMQQGLVPKTQPVHRNRKWGYNGGRRQTAAFF